MKAEISRYFYSATSVQKIVGAVVAQRAKLLYGNPPWHWVIEIYGLAHGNLEYVEVNDKLEVTKSHNVAAEE